MSHNFEDTDLKIRGTRRFCLDCGLIIYVFNDYTRFEYSNDYTRFEYRCAVFLGTGTRIIDTNPIPSCEKYRSSKESALNILRELGHPDIELSSEDLILNCKICNQLFIYDYDLNKDRKWYLLNSYTWNMNHAAMSCNEHIMKAALE